MAQPGDHVSSLSARQHVPTTNVAPRAAALKAAARRLRRWPAASLDRGRARPQPTTVGTSRQAPLDTTGPIQARMSGSEIRDGPFSRMSLRSCGLHDPRAHVTSNHVTALKLANDCSSRSHLPGLSATNAMRTVWPD